MSRIKDVSLSRRARRSQNTVVSIGTATHIGAALRAAKRNAELEELERHLLGLRSLEQNDLSVILVTQWLEEQLRARPSRRRVTLDERCTQVGTADGYMQRGDDA